MSTCLRSGKGVRVLIEHTGAPLTCPKCGREWSPYDARRREWRHLDTCPYRTVLVAEVPRINSDQDGVLQTKVPCAEPDSRFTARFEALAIDWLKEASITGVARRLGASWSERDGIMPRAVRRGLARRTTESVTSIGVDETSFQKRHEYVTVVSDLERPRVLDIGDGRGTEPLAAYFAWIGPEKCAALRVVARVPARWIRPAVANEVSLGDGPGTT
jgi:transposase